METKQSGKVRSGIPMSEEELKEWKKTFSDIEESINNVMSGEDNGNYVGQNSRQICKEGC